ncbi:hypothetical protein pdam_00023601 [Pocillopora damicornis]|uniref:Uncharacterized protein n=1 Tax=Pocillopora damicornis TaxID=46731 RepID=A0A3M6TWK0_POCDA|nr:hypothetical protein pdam_00023601 [Pocillopora damicornis]
MRCCFAGGPRKRCHRAQTNRRKSHSLFWVTDSNDRSNGVLEVLKNAAVHRIKNPGSESQQENEPKYPHIRRGPNKNVSEAMKA